jgi:transposase
LKHLVITDADGVPLAAKLTAGDRGDVRQLVPLAGAVPPITGKVCDSIRRSGKLLPDREYDSDLHRKQFIQRRIAPFTAERNTEHGSGLGIFRWVAEETITWLHQFRRLWVRHERPAHIHMAFATLGCILIRHRFLIGPLT